MWLQLLCARIEAFARSPRQLSARTRKTHVQLDSLTCDVDIFLVCCTVGLLGGQVAWTRATAASARSPSRGACSRAARCCSRRLSTRTRSKSGSRRRSTSGCTNGRASTRPTRPPIRSLHFQSHPSHPESSVSSPHATCPLRASNPYCSPLHQSRNPDSSELDQIDGWLKCTFLTSIQYAYSFNLVDSRVSGRVAIAREPRGQRLPRGQQLSVRSARRVARSARDGARWARANKREPLAAAREERQRCCLCQRQMNLTQWSTNYD